MSLRTFRWPRVVVLNPRASALEAARAMENNEIGTVLVQDGGHVVGIVTDRTPHEAKDLIAQLPSLLHAQLRRLPDGPDRSVTRAAIEDQLMQRLEIDRPRATDILNAVGRTLQQNVSAGQTEDVRGQLPDELRSLFPRPPAPVPY